VTTKRDGHNWFTRARSLFGRTRVQSNGRSSSGSSTTREREWRTPLRRRLLVGAVVFGLWGLSIEARLLYLQVLRHDQLVARAAGQQNRNIPINPKRGEILDREGRVLAYSVDADTIYAVPTDIDDPIGTAAALCSALDDCSPAKRKIIAIRLSTDKAFAYVDRKVSPDAAQRIAALELDGVGFLKEDRRYYPNKELAAHLLGYVGTDNQGLSGIESTYDQEIRGRPGKVLVQTDVRHRAFSRVEQLPTTGATIELTIDKYLQHIAERELHAAIREHQAHSGTVVVLQPHTGEILALANEPTFNPNAFSHASKDSLRNRGVQDIYEPGSTFKIVTTSAALEEGVTTRDELFDVSAGVIRIGNSTISDMHTYGVLSFEDVIVKSSNVGTIKVGLRLGPERLSRYVRRFGFGEALSRDLPGESAGIVHNPSDLNDRAVASVAMGYQVSVTPLQMAAAVSAVANGGELVEPQAVRAIVRNGVRVQRGRRVVRRAISEETAAELTSIMEAVVERGTARAAQIPGYSVAGKTGTSEKVIDGRYSKVAHNASFVGFVPSRDPALTILVLIDTPQGFYTGGRVAAPVFQRIAEAALRHLAVAPTIHPNPPFLVTSKVSPRIESTSTQFHLPPTLKPVDDEFSERGVMPDLRGLSARQALEALSAFGLTARARGDGFVVRHEPSPGVLVNRGATATLYLKRHFTEASSAQ